MATEFTEGQKVYITLRKNGYWKGQAKGHIARVTEKSYVVSSGSFDRDRTYPKNSTALEARS